MLSVRDFRSRTSPVSRWQGEAARSGARDRPSERPFGTERSPGNTFSIESALCRPIIVHRDTLTGHGRKRRGHFAVVSPLAPRNVMDVLWFRLSRRHHHQPIDSRFRAPRFARTAEHLPHGGVRRDSTGSFRTSRVTGSNLTMAFVLHSVSHTLS